MNNLQFLTLTQNIEKKYEVHKLQLFDMHLWPSIKCILFNVFVKNEPSSNTLNSFRNILNALKQRAYHTLNCLKDFKHFSLLKKSDYLFFGTNGSKNLFQGGYYDYLMQPIIEKYSKKGKKCFFIERGLFTKYPRSMESFQSRIVEELSAIITILLYPFLVNFLRYNKNLSTIIGYINKEFDGREQRFLERKIYKYLINTLLLSKLYGVLLFFIKPKKAYIASYYSLTGIAMLYACNIKNIETVEVQHGNIYNNFAYVGWKNSPNKSYNTLPNSFEFWSNFEAKLFQNANSKFFLARHSYKNTGIPWGHFWQQNNSITKEYIKTFSNKAANYPLRVLVTLRHSIFKKNEWKNLIKIINETEKDVFWFIRKHPSMTNDYMSSDPSLNEVCKLNKPNIDYDLANNSLLYGLLRSVDLHITTASNAAAEATAFGIPTIFISNLAKKEMPFLIDNEFNLVITDYYSLKKMLYTIIKKRAQL